MRIPAGLPLFCAVAILCASAQATVYKCREASGSILYTDSECEADATTVAVMPNGSIRFDYHYQTDEQVEEELRLLSEQENALVKELAEAQAAPGESLAQMPEAHALRRQILILLESVRSQKMLLLGRGVSLEEGEELVMDPGK